MNKQFVAILAILLVVIGGAALMVFRQGETQKPAVTSQLGQPLLKGLKASEVASITIREPKQTLTLMKKHLHLHTAMTIVIVTATITTAITSTHTDAHTHGAASA